MTFHRHPKNSIPGSNPGCLAERASNRDTLAAGGPHVRKVAKLTDRGLVQSVSGKIKQNRAALDRRTEQEGQNREVVRRGILPAGTLEARAHLGV